MTLQFDNAYAWDGEFTIPVLMDDTWKQWSGRSFTTILPFGTLYFLILDAKQNCGLLLVTFLLTLRLSEGGVTLKSKDTNSNSFIVTVRQQLSAFIKSHPQ